jgi:uncharacterized protein (TIGR02001 family)
MKKKIAAVFSIATVTAALATSVSAQSMYYEDAVPRATAVVGWESEYVFRGVQASKRVVRPGLALEMNDAYAGVEGILSTDSGLSHLHELDFYAGFRHDLDDLLLMDLGGVLYYFPRLDREMPREDDLTGELYLGVGLGVPLDPWLYFSYDVVLEDFTIEGRLSHEIPLDDQWSLELAAAGGHAWLREGKPWMAGSVNYFYAETRADVRYAINETTSVSAGGRYSTNDLSRSDRLSSSGANRANLWWGAAFTAEF